MSSTAIVQHRCGVVVIAPDAPAWGRTKDGCTCQAYRAVNDAECLASRLSKGDRVEFRNRINAGIFPHRDKEPLSAWKRGTVRRTSFYDGISISVYEDDPDDLIEHRLHPQFGDDLRVLQNGSSPPPPDV